MSFGTVKGITVQINGDTSKLQAEIKKITSQYSGLDRTMSALKKSMTLDNGTLTGYKSFATYQDLIKSKIQQTTKYLNTYENAQKNFDKTLDEWRKNLSFAKEDVSKYTEKLEQHQNQYDRLNTKLEDSKYRLKQWNTALAEGEVTQEQYDKATEKLEKDIEKLSINLGKQDDKIRKTQAHLENAKKSQEEWAYALEHSDEALMEIQAKILMYENELRQYNLTLAKSQTQLVAFSNISEVVGSSLMVLGNGIQKISQAIKPFSTMATVVLAGATYEVVSFEDAWAGVLKTVDGTPQQLQQVNDGLKLLAKNTASSYQELAQMAETAGQLGIETDNIIEFTEVSAKLGDTTVLSAEEASTALAKMKNIFHGMGSMSNDYYSRFGSAVVDLGNNFATTEDEIVNMSLVMSEAGHQSGMAETDILALSTALTSMGIKANAGGSSMSKMLQKITKAVALGSDQLDSFAEISGMTADEFSKAWKDDAGQAFLKFIEGIAGESDDASVALQNLHELGLDTEVRLTRSMGALAGSTDVYASALKMANSAWEENIALNVEADKRYATLKTKLLQTWENIKQLGEEIGHRLVPYIQQGLDYVNKFIDYFKNLDETQKDNVARILAITAVASPLLGIIGKATYGVGKFVYGLKDVPNTLIDTVSKMTLFKNSLSTFSFAGFLKQMKNAFGLVAGETKDVSKIFGFANESTMQFITTSLKWAGVAGAVALASYGVAKAIQVSAKAGREKIAQENEEIGIIDKVISKQNEYKDTIQKHMQTAEQYTASIGDNSEYAKELVKSMTKLNSVEELNSGQKAALVEYVNRLNGLYPDLNLTIDENTGHVQTNSGEIATNTKELENNIDAFQKASKVKAYENALSEVSQALGIATVSYKDVSSSMNIWREASNRNKRELEGLNTLLKEGEIEEYNKQTLDLSNQAVVLDEQFNTLKTSMEENGQTLLEATQKYLELSQAMSDSGDLSETVRVEMEQMVESAEKAGYEIPSAISDALKDNASVLEIQEGIEALAQMQTYKTMIDDANLNGKLIPKKISQGIIMESSSVQDATNKLSNLINFQRMTEQAGLEGADISAELANAIANGEVDITNSANLTGQAYVDEIQKRFDDAKKNTEKDAKEVANSADQSSEFKQSATNSTNAYADGLDFSKAFKKVKEYVEGANDLLDTVGKKATSVSNSVSDAKNGIPSGIARIGGDFIPRLIGGYDAESLGRYSTPSVGASVDVVNSTRTMNSVRDRKNTSMQGIQNVLNKLDSFMDTFNNMQISTSSQLVLPNGEALTDIVQETMMVRETLTNIGKGNG